MEHERTRRMLDFSNLDAVVRDVELLFAGGYDKVGKWDLGQVCGHLAEWMRFPLDGFPMRAPSIRLLLWPRRDTVGRWLLRRTLTWRSMPSGRMTLAETIPAPGDDATGIERLRRAVARFRDHVGRFHASPLFGELDRATWEQLQLVHCAHHLSFLLPRVGRSRPASGAGVTAVDSVAPARVLRYGGGRSDRTLRPPIRTVAHG